MHLPRESGGSCVVTAPVATSSGNGVFVLLLRSLAMSKFLTMFRFTLFCPVETHDSTIDRFGDHHPHILISGCQRE
jgi:hypothetical protein